MPRKHHAATCPGKFHSAEENQDTWAIVQSEQNGTLAVLADGAGSSSRGAEAARMAVESLLVEVDASGLSSEADLVNAVHYASWMLSSERIRTGTCKSDWGCTILVVNIRPDHSCVGISVGDSWATYASEDGWVQPFVRHQGSYEGETRFLIESQPEDWSIAQWVLPEDASMFLLTDGLDPIAFDRRLQTPFAPFFNQIEHALLSSATPQDDLSAFLSSERVKAATNDDRTMIWIPPSTTP